MTSTAGGLDLLVDARRAPGRNDELFERVQAEYRERLFGGFRRVAVVMASVAGRLQVERYRREQELGPMILCSDREDALRWFREG